VSKNKKSSGSTQNEFVVCDLEFSGFQKSLAKLSAIEIEHFFDVLEKKIQKMGTSFFLVELAA